jgi:hypothetical protein
MKGPFRVSEERTVNAIVVFVCIVVFAILLVLLVLFFINQATLIGQFEEAVDLYKDALRARSVEGADIAADDMPLLWSEKVKYLEQLNAMHKQVSTTDLFVFIYGFLSSVLIGVSGYLVKRSERQLKDVSDEYTKLKKIADELERKISNSDMLFFVSQILSDAITDISTYKHTLENGYLVQFKQEVRQIADWVKDIKLDEIDRSVIAKFEQRFGTIRGLYEDASKVLGTHITKNHKRHIQIDFDRIRSKLDEMQGKN